MTYNDSSTQFVLLLTIFLVVSGVIRLFYTRKHKEGPNKRKQPRSYLILFAVTLIWLIGACVALMEGSFDINEPADNKFLQTSVEAVLLIALAFLFVVSGIMMKQSASQKNYNHENFIFIAKHLIYQMIFIVVLTLFYAIQRV